MLTFIRREDYPEDLKDFLDNNFEGSDYRIYGAEYGYLLEYDYRSGPGSKVYIAEDDGCGGNAVYYNDSAAYGLNPCLAMRPSIVDDDYDYCPYVIDGLTYYTREDIDRALIDALGTDNFNLDDAISSLSNEVIASDEPFGTLCAAIRYMEQYSVYPFEEHVDYPIRQSGKVHWLN